MVSAQTNPRVLLVKTPAQETNKITVGETVIEMRDRAKTTHKTVRAKAKGTGSQIQAIVNKVLKMPTAAQPMPVTTKTHKITRDKTNPTTKESKINQNEVDRYQNYLLPMAIDLPGSRIRMLKTENKIRPGATNPEETRTLIPAISLLMVKPILRVIHKLRAAQTQTDQAQVARTQMAALNASRTLLQAETRILLSRIDLNKSQTRILETVSKKEMRHEVAK